MLRRYVRAVLTYVCVALIGAAATAAPKGPAPTVDGKVWQGSVEVARPPHNGRPQPATVGFYWLPPDCKTVRGLIAAGRILLERTICEDPQIRKAAAEKGLGILYFDPHLDGVFDYVHRGSDQVLQTALAETAKKSGHPEIEQAPLLTVGHSTGGIFCRNVAYWKPERVIGILHIKSGNLQDMLPDKSRSLAGVPFLAMNGEFEEYGPMGGDLKAGLRSEYSLNPADKKQDNQTQWVMIRMQLLERRKKNPDNLMSLVVHRNQGHTTWDDRMSAIAAQFIRSAADARLRPSPSGGTTPVRCTVLKAADGWLSDADIKAPKFKAAPYKDYQGDRTTAFWHLDQAMADAVGRYHAEPWPAPDPTAGKSTAERFTPPPVLQDSIDKPSE